VLGRGRLVHSDKRIAPVLTLELIIAAIETMTREEALVVLHAAEARNLKLFFDMSDEEQQADLDARGLE
jgi:hypothetical protein